MSAPVRSQIAGDTSEDHAGAPLLRTSATVTVDGCGRPVATLELHGELCPTSAADLECEVDRLLEDGVVELTVDLQGLRFCTSHGLDVWQDADERLRPVGGGVRLIGATGVVRQVLEVVQRDDPTFTPIVEGPVT